MAKVLIVYESETDTETMVEAVTEGLYSIGGIEVITKEAVEASADDLFGADGLAFGSPTEAGSMAKGLKDFFGRTKAAGKDVAGKAYIAFGVVPVSGGKEVLNAIDSACADLGLRKAAEGVVSRGEPSPEFLTLCYDVGNKLAREVAK